MISCPGERAAGAYGISDLPEVNRMALLPDIVRTRGAAEDRGSAIVYDARYSAASERRGDTARAAPSCSRESTSLVSAGDIVWIPSVSAGFTTAVVLDVDSTHQRLLTRLHPAAIDELRTIHRAFPLAQTEQATRGAVIQPNTHPQQKGQQLDHEHLQQFNEEQLSAPHKHDGGSGVAAVAETDAINGLHGRAAGPARKQQDVLGVTDAHICSESFVPVGETWTYKPLPPPPAAVPEDAVALDCLSAASVLQLLQHRFLRKQIYTFAAHVLLAVNPCQTLPGLYGYDVVEIYRHWRGRQSAVAAAGLLAPHVAQFLGFSSTSICTAEVGGNACAAQALGGGGSADNSPSGSKIFNDSFRGTTGASATGGVSRQQDSRVHTGGTGSHNDSIHNIEATNSSFTSSNFSMNTLSAPSFPPAHPFAVAQDAHRRLRGEGQKQTIIVSGESGAGKTETSKILMLYLTEVGSLLASSSRSQSSTRDRRTAGHSITDHIGEELYPRVGKHEEEQQQALHTDDGRDEKSQSRQAQRRAAAAALLHAAAAKHTAGSTPSASGASCFPPDSPAACRNSAEAAVGVVASSSSFKALLHSTADSPSAFDTGCETTRTQYSAATTQGQELATGELQQRILSCNPVLEAFCNAKTRRNSNSSRVGRLTLLHFDRGGLLHGASIKTYLLESTRVCSHPLWERNFHVFYQLLRGSRKEDLERRRLHGCCEGYRLLMPTPAALAAHQRSVSRLPTRRLIVSAASPTAASTTSPRGPAGAATEPPPPSQEELSKDAENYALLVEALFKTGFSVVEVEELFDAIAGLLHLSNVSFKEIPSLKAGATHALVIRHRRRSGAAPAGRQSGNSGASAGVPPPAIAQDFIPPVECAAELLRLPVEQLEEVLLWETLTTRHETLRKQRRAEQAAAARDALIKCTYTRIVQYILTKLNQSVLARQQSRATSASPIQQQVHDTAKRLLYYQSPDNGNHKSENSTGNTRAGGARQDASVHNLSEKTSTLEVTDKRARGFSSRRGDAEEGGAAALWGSDLSTGILDIYGFESLESGSNGFEQLCINYANEKQQQIFLQRAISEELRLYRCEGLLGVLSSLQPALLSSSDNRSSSEGFPCSALSPLSIRPSVASTGAHVVHSCTERSSISSSSAKRNNSSSLAERDSGSSFSGCSRKFLRLNRPPGLLLQGERLSCEKKTEELLFCLSEGLFKRLDDNSRLRARGQQQRLDVHFWRDFFSFCRQREIQIANIASDRNTSGNITATSTGRTSKSNAGNHEMTGEEQHEQHQPPVLFRLLRSTGNCVPAVAAAHSVKSEDGHSPTGGGAATARNVDAALMQQQYEKTGMHQLVAAKDVRPLHADAAAAASTLQQGVFVVRHFAGHVEYRVDGWLARNNDKADAEIESLMSLSGLRALQAADASVLAGGGVCGDGSSTASSAAGGLLKSSQARNRSPVAPVTAGLMTTTNTGSSSNNRHFASVSQQFIADLRQLMGELQSSDVHLHFIRCFVSNRGMRPLLLDRALLLRQCVRQLLLLYVRTLSSVGLCLQLQQSGTVALIHVLHKGFPHRLPLSPLAAVFKSKLKDCISAATARLEQQQRSEDDTAARDLRAGQLRQLHALRVENVPDGRLVTVAVEMLPDCPRGTVSCGISSIFFKAGAFLPATTLLRSPEAFFSQPRMLLHLQHELTRRRWRFAVAASVHLRRRLMWLLRRVRLLRTIKQRFIICAVRALLLRRCILLPLLLRVKKRAAAAAALKLLHRVLAARGFHAWLLAYRRAAAAKGAALSLAARVTAASAGKGEHPQICDVSAIQLQGQLDTSDRPTLVRRRSSSSSKYGVTAADKGLLAVGSAAAHNEDDKQLVEARTKHRQQRSELQGGSSRSGGRGDLEEAEAAASICKERLYNSSLQRPNRKVVASCWWKAALFGIHATCSCCSMEYSEANIPAAADTPSARKICEYFLLYTGTKLHAVQLLVTQQLQPPKEYYKFGSDAATATKPLQIHIQCYAFLLVTSSPVGEAYYTQHHSCLREDTKEEKTAWKTLGPHAPRQVKQQQRQQEVPQQQQHHTSQEAVPSNQKQLQWSLRQQTDKQADATTMQQRVGHQGTSSETLPAAAAHGFAEASNNVKSEPMQPPALICLAQHARHRQLFVGCDRQARIFLLPFHLPVSSTTLAAGEDSSELNLYSAAGAPPSITEENPPDVVTITATGCGATENGYQQQQRNLETQRKHTTWRRGRDDQQQFALLEQQPLRSAFSRSQKNSTHERVMPEETRLQEQHKVAKDKEEKDAAEACCFEQHSQPRNRLQDLPSCEAGLYTSAKPLRDTSSFTNDAFAEGSTPAIPDTRMVSMIAGTPGGAVAASDSTNVFVPRAWPETANPNCGPLRWSPLPPAAAAVNSKDSHNLLQNAYSTQGNQCSCCEQERKAALKDKNSRGGRGLSSNGQRSDGTHLDNSSSLMPNNPFHRSESSSNLGSIRQTSCSNSNVSELRTSQILPAHDGTQSEERFLPCANSLHVEAADPHARSSSTAKKITLKSLGGGQPSTWLPALVSPSLNLSKCLNQHANPPAATAATSTSSAFAAGGNPYLALFRRPTPLPPPHLDAPPLSLPVSVPLRQQRGQKKQICLRVAPWLEAQGRRGSGLTLYLPRDCCFPRSVGPAAWVPSTLLERAEQRHEQAVLQHHRQQLELEKHEQLPQRTVSLQRHQQDQQQRNQERRQDHQHLHQRHVTVRPVRLRFASSYSTQHILVLAYVSAASSSKSRAEKSLGDCPTSNVRTKEQPPQKHDAVAVVAGLWAVILVDLLRQRALDWKEIYAAQPDVIESARFHRRQLPFLFPHSTFAESYEKSSSATDINASSSGRNARGCERNTPGGDKSNINSDGPDTTGKHLHGKRRSTSSAANTSMISPSQIVSTALLESFGEGKWIVAGPGVLGLLQVRGLPSALFFASHYNSDKNAWGKASSKPQGEMNRKATGANEAECQTLFTKANCNTEEAKPSIDVLWNQANVQHYCPHRRKSLAGETSISSTSLAVASTWITGCIYTETPLSSLQDIGPTHPLLAHGALVPDSKIAQALQHHFHHLLMLTTAGGDLLLLRWLPQKRRLRLLRRLPSLEEQQLAASTVIWRRLLRVHYADASDEEEAAAEQLLPDSRSCCSGSCAAAALRSSLFQPGATPVLRLSRTHPHACKQRQRQRNNGQGERYLQRRRLRGRWQREEAREEEKLAARRWLDDIGALVAYTNTEHCGNGLRLETAAASSTTSASGLNHSTTDHSTRAPTAGMANGSVRRQAEPVLRLEKPPLIKKRQLTLQIVKDVGEIEGCSTSADGTTTGGGASPKNNIDGDNEGGDQRRHMRSSLKGGSFTSGSDNDSKINSGRSEPPQVEQDITNIHKFASPLSFSEGAENRIAPAITSRRKPLPRSGSQLQQVDPLPLPDPRHQQQQQQSCLELHRAQEEQPQHQSFRHRRETSATQKTTKKHSCSAVGQGNSEQRTNARASECNSLKYADGHMRSWTAV